MHASIIHCHWSITEYLPFSLLHFSVIQSSCNIMMCDVHHWRLTWYELSVMHYEVLLWVWAFIPQKGKSFLYIKKIYYPLFHAKFGPCDNTTYRGLTQGCQFSGKSLNSGPGNLFSGHMLHFCVCTNWKFLDSFQAHSCFLTGNPCLLSSVPEGH